MTKKGMICVCPVDVCMRNLWQKAESGKITGSESTIGFPRASCFEKPMHSVPETWGCTYNVIPWNAKDMRKWDEKLDSCAAKKGTKNIVSSDFVKIRLFK